MKIYKIYIDNCNNEIYFSTYEKAINYISNYMQKYLDETDSVEALIGIEVIRVDSDF